VRAYLTAGIALGYLDNSISSIQKLGKVSSMEEIQKVYGLQHKEFTSLDSAVRVSDSFREMDFGSLEGAKVVNLTEEDEYFLFRL